MHIAFVVGVLTAPLPPIQAGDRPVSGGTAPLLWPLEPPHGLTSGFAEYRQGHYHGGIDLTTERRIGRPLRAAGDGSVWRIRVSGSGYGRALYLRLADGRTVVTAHMEAFAPAIAAWVAAAQESLGRYEVDLHPPPGRLPVRAGEPIGISGESGAGPPHLHFELRDGPDAEIGLHPLRNGLAVTDSVAPVIGRLLMDALATPEALATRRGERREPGVRRLAPGRYALEDTVRVTGACVLAVEAFDPGAGGSRGAPWRVALHVDGVPEFELRFDAFEWSRAHEVELAWDPESVAAGSSFVLRLFRPVGARDSRFQTAAVGAGVIGRGARAGVAGRAVRSFRIEVEDVAGNRAVLDGVLRFAAVGDPAGRRRVASEHSAVVGLDTLLVPGRAGTLRVGAATVTLTDSTLFGAARWQLTPLAADTIGEDSPGGIEIRAPGAVLDAPMSVSLRLPPNAQGRGVALYRRRAGGGWSWVGADSIDGGFGGVTRAFGRFALLADVTPPRVTIELPGAVTAGERPRIGVRVTENRSGVTWRTLAVSIDAVEQIVEFDPEANRLEGASRRPLEPGVHRLLVRARDRAGNETVVAHMFRTVR